MHVIPALMLLTALAAAPNSPAAAPKFDLHLLDGSKVSGSLVRWDDAGIVLETAAGQTTFEAGKLASVTPQSPPAAPLAKPAVWVDLADGSRLAAAEYTAEQGRAKVEFSAGDALELPTALVDAVRFQSATDATALEWSRLRGKRVRADVLVTGNSDAIDDHQGAVDDVSDKKVRFVLDGQARGVPRAKVFGLIYFHATAASVPESPYAIVDSTGSRWSAASLKLAAGALEFTSPHGRTTRRGLDQIAKIDLSCGKIVYLSDLNPDSETVTPNPFTVTARDLPSRAAFSRARRNQNFESKLLRTQGEEFHRGLAVRGGSQMAWTLPGKFSRLEGKAGIDDYVRPLGNVRLQFLGDGKMLLDATVDGNQKEARAISLDISGVRRLVLVVASLGNLGAGDQLDLANLRLIK